MTDRSSAPIQPTTIPEAEARRLNPAAPPVGDLSTSSSDGREADIGPAAAVHQEEADSSSSERSGPAEQPLADKGADTARDAKERVQSQAKGLVAERKDEAVGRVTGLARALEGAASSLDENGQATEARLTRQAASSLARMADATQGKEIEDIVAAVEDFGRRQPVAFLTGAVFAGFALSRFLKSSAGKRSQQVDAGSRVETRPDPVGRREGSYS